MNANFDFWFDEMFHNTKLSFRYFNDYGIGVHSRMNGDLYAVNDYLYGFIEYNSHPYKSRATSASAFYVAKDKSL